MGKERICGHALLMGLSQTRNLQGGRTKLLGAAPDLVFHKADGRL